MLAHEKKKRENIIEYLLYLFHTEDILRSLTLNLDVVEEVVIEPEGLDSEEKMRLKMWYKELIEEMERNKLENRGHIEEVYHLLGELSYLHNALMSRLKDPDYVKLWKTAYPAIQELTNKSGEAVHNPIEVCFNGVYGVMVLKMKKREISDETLVATQQFSNLLNYLGKKYHEVTRGELSLR